MKTKYTFPGKQAITSQLVSGEFLWIAFFGEDSICSLYKSSVHNPNYRYWEVEITAEEIKYMIEDNSYLYLALDHSVYIGAKVKKTSPTTINYFTKEDGITEEAVDLVDDGTYIYFLILGTGATGENTKICKYNKSTRAFVETIDLSDVNNAKKIDIDNQGNIWVVSNLDSVPIITKIWMDTGWEHTNQELS
jgi:hypothetical protein